MDSVNKDKGSTNDINANKEALKIAIAYFIVGAIWIIFSDEVLYRIKDDFIVYKNLQTYKGWVFVAVTAIMIYSLVYNSIKKIKKMNEIVQKSLAELSNTTTDLLVTQEMLFQEKTLMDSVIKNAKLVVLTWDLDGSIKGLNPYGEKIMGYKEEEVIGKSWVDLFLYEEEKAKVPGLIKYIKSGKSLKNSIGDVCKSKYGDDIEFIWTDSPMRDDNGEITHVISFGTDITGQKQMMKKLNDLAYFDNLTGLPNRTKLNMDSTNFINDAVKNNTKIAFLYIDLDNFKQINDTLGHDSGDELLIHLANILSEEKGDRSYLAKLSEDEYGFIIKDIVEENDIILVAEKILAKIREPWFINNNEFLMSASIGISIFPDHARDFTDLMKCANMGMYHMKSIGKNGFAFYNDEMGSRIANNTFLINQIKRAIAEEQFTLHYQPIIDLSLDTLFGVEALLRWYHPERGYISPMDYIPLLEETGQIFEVTSLVLKMAIEQKSIWSKNGYSSLKVAVNISSKSLVQGSIVDEIETLLKEYKINPEELSIEVTETAFMDNLESCIYTMTKLDGLGIDISLDDFGTGHSSLSQLKNLPIQYVKMDQEFIKTMIRYSEEEVVVRSIINLAHILGLNVIAEGIETEEQKNILIESGCDFGQGYYLARPMTSEVFEEKFLYNTKVKKDD